MVFFGRIYIPAAGGAGCAPASAPDWGAAEERGRRLLTRSHFFKISELPERRGWYGE